MKRKKKLLISFSGGRTSAYMCWWLLNIWEDRHEYEIIVVFANTGKEVEGTLQFIDECDQAFGLDLVWVEAYPSDKGKGWAVNHKIVTYETAARKGEPFEAMIAKLGIPSTAAPFCSPQLKKAAIEDFMRAIGWNNYYSAIGYRIDEPTRMSENWAKLKHFYPLATIHPQRRSDIMGWWAKQDFDLNIHPDEGNCDNCWKKDFKLLARNAQRKPRSFDWWQKMTDKYGYLNPRNAPLEPPFNFYRGNLSPADILQMDASKIPPSDLFTSSCTESCEPF